MLYLAAVWEKLMTSCTNLVSPSKCRSAKRIAAGKSVGLALSRLSWQDLPGNAAAAEHQSNLIQHGGECHDRRIYIFDGVRKSVLRGEKNLLCPRWIIQLRSFALGSLWKQQSFMYKMVFLKALRINLTWLSSIPAFLTQYSPSSALVVRTDVFLWSVKWTSCLQISISCFHGKAKGEL